MGLYGPPLPRTPSSVLLTDANGNAGTDSGLTWDGAKKTMTAQKLTQSGAPLLHGARGKLRRFHAALADRTTNPVNIGVIGDSLAEGSAASTPAKRWLELLQTQLRAAYQPAGIAGGLGYQPAWGVASFTPRITIANAPATLFNGLGLRSRYLISTGQTLTLAATQTGVDIFYDKGPASTWAGTFTITVDGSGTGAWTVNGAAANGTTNVIDSTAGSYSAGNKVQVRGLSAAAHTIVLTWTTGRISINGMMSYNGDETQGIRVWDMAHAGLSSSTYITNYATWLGALATVAPHLILLEFGLNESTVPMTQAAFTTNLQSLLTNIRAQYGTLKPSIVFVASHQTTLTNVSASWADYVATMYSVAAADGNVGVIDFYERMGGAATNDMAATLLADGTHPNDVGGQYWSDAIYNAISP